MTFEQLNTIFHHLRGKHKQPFTFWYFVDNFYPWKDIVGKKVSKLRSIAELRAFYGTFWHVFLCLPLCFCCCWLLMLLSRMLLFLLYLQSMNSLQLLVSLLWLTSQLYSAFMLLLVFLLLLDPAVVDIPSVPVVSSFGTLLLVLLFASMLWLASPFF